MKLLATAIVSSSLLALGFAPVEQAQAPLNNTPIVEVRRNGSQPSTKGLAKNFTGVVRIDPLFAARDPARTSGANVTFEPNARTAWHTHPLGQTLIVAAGSGYVQQLGRPIQEIRPGDVVQIPPGVKHWHGATPTTAMTHIALQEALDGKNVDWMEQVSDDQYRP
ncbi:cupin 2 domain-containing protein (plasmid) [Leptolyngbya boryana NIES-2135]|jgi:quercetin dioxygenase-like cupin family protein|uniref:Cupin 2 domain-containing protein n=1 Tax=Leptolyngbya boryana NIES-2135 TaxID=1973484 RepID=A0A1Z4JR43_LEPBY|nr:MULTISPECIES: cupin domain-containing protein [Leptolyngbya]BAY59179.1 cupin 2 domain-containing protein [Leptolyngbya boryana NIES-2135]MBD2372767.1 cupin domain-containing protein [Leptolyngbya sp. FACHB-238]MBD2397481.1 cupin domain-containing protein [Leptolyngbya sp. FACHB-239]MBD2403714.1 cupin domain-containing protein [Leptolyngbya sp. FACHB-402]ULP33373.1 cupin domain-containing protein [Leptolyngbya boryana IU 594]